VSTHFNRYPPLPAHVARAVAFFESLTAADVARIGEVYAGDAWFKDPFNEVRGVDAIARIYAHLFEQVDAPRFVVLEALVDGRTAVLVWDFEFGFRRPLPGARRRIRGCSNLRFDAAGLVVHHRDHWDTAELYEHVPLLGGLLRALRRRARTPTGD
jgi:steroid Delta-isomerase